MKTFKQIFQIKAFKTIFILETIFCPERLPFALNTASTDEIEDAEWICCREPKGKVRKKIFIILKIFIIFIILIETHQNGTDYCPSISSPCDVGTKLKVKFFLNKDLFLNLIKVLSLLHIL